MFFETSLNFCLTAWYYIPEDSAFQNPQRGNLKPSISALFARYEHVGTALLTSDSVILLVRVYIHIIHRLLLISFL